MADADRLTVMHCPKSGGPLEMTGDEVTCGYCGTHLERPRPQPVERERVVERVVIAPAFQPQPEPRRVRARRGSCTGTLAMPTAVGHRHE